MVPEQGRNAEMIFNINDNHFKFPKFNDFTNLLTMSYLWSLPNAEHYWNKEKEKNMKFPSATTI